VILTAHQPVYLPWLGLFHKIALADKFISFDQVQYVPKDWINRNKVMASNGPAWLTVPCMKVGRFESNISETKIDNTTNWASKHWKTLQLNYGKSKFFKRYADFFEGTYNRSWDLLADLNMHMLLWFLNELSIKVPVQSAGDYKFQGEKSGLVLDMCKQLGAKLYIFGALGRDYADQEAFSAAGVDIMFQDYQHPVYAQMKRDFVSHLAIVDLLFNCGPDSYEILMSGNVSPESLRHG
jgi:hypothetical protein